MEDDNLLSISQALENQAEKFNFFQAVRIIEHALTKIEKSERKQGRIFFDSPSISSFSPSTINKIKKRNRHQWKITTGFIGLYGPHGALPEYFLELLKGREGIPLKDFLDIFGHRLIELFYLSWKKNRIDVDYEENHTINKRNFFKETILSLHGILPYTVKSDFLEKEEGLVSFCRFFQGRTPTASNLKKILSYYFNIPVRIAEFSRNWCVIPSDQCTYLCYQQQMNILGKNAMIGTRVCGAYNRFKMVIGPLSYDKYKDFFPNSKTQTKLHQVIRLYIGYEYDYEIQLLLKSDELPGLNLSNGQAKRLGWDTWLACSPAQFNIEGLVINV